MPFKAVLTPTKPIEEFAVGDAIEGTLCECDLPHVRKPYLKKQARNSTRCFLACANWQRDGYTGCGTKRIDSLSASALAHQRRADDNLILARRYQPLSMLMHQSYIFPPINHNARDSLCMTLPILTDPHGAAASDANHADQTPSSDDSRMELDEIASSEATSSPPSMPAAMDPKVLEDIGQVWVSSLVRTERARFELTAKRKPAELLPVPFEYPASRAERAGVAWLCKKLIDKGCKLPKQVWRMRSMEAAAMVQVASSAPNASSSSATTDTLIAYDGMPHDDLDVVIEWCDPAARKLGSDMKVMLRHKWINIKIVDLLFEKAPCVALQLQDAARDTYGWLFGTADWWLIPLNKHATLESIGDWIIVDTARFRQRVMSQSIYNVLRPARRVSFPVTELPFNPSEYLASTAAGAISTAAPPDASTDMATAPTVTAAAMEDSPCPALASSLAPQCGTCAGTHSVGLHGEIAEPIIDWDVASGVNAADFIEQTFLKMSFTGGIYYDEYLVSPIEPFHQYCKQHCLLIDSII